MYEEIFRKLSDLTSIKDDKHFVMGLLTYNSLDLMKSVEILKSNNMASSTPALLRKIYENSIILMGFQLKEISLSDFANYEALKESKRISFVDNLSKKIYSFSLRHQGREKADFFKTLMKVIKNQLSVYTHSNVWSLLYYTAEKFSSEKVKELLNVDLNAMIQIVELLFTTVINDIYDVNIKKAKNSNAYQLNEILKDLKTKNENISKEYNRLINIVPIKNKVDEKKMELKDVLTRENMAKVRDYMNNL